MSTDSAADPSPPSESIEICHRKVPKSVMVLVFQCLDKATLKVASQVSKSFNSLSKHPSLGKGSMYSGPNTCLPQLQEVIPFPPPAVLQTTLPNVTTVIPVPQYSTVLPESTKVLLPVLPETVPLIAQVPDVVTTSVPAEEKVGDAGGVAVAKPKEIVQISQVLPGYAPSYAQEYVPTEVNSHSFSAFANTISFNVSRYPTLLEMTNSKDYEKQKSLNNAKEASKNTKESTDDSLKTVKHTTSADSNIEYVPAEYFRGAENGSIQTVSASGSISFVKPDVLASGRVLTYMTPVPSLALITTSTTMPTVAHETTTANTNVDKDQNQNGETNGHSEAGQNGHSKQ